MFKDKVSNKPINNKLYVCVGGFGGGAELVSPNRYTKVPSFCRSMARMRSNSEKSEGLMGLEMEVTSTPLLFDAALILPSALSPFLYVHFGYMRQSINHKYNKNPNK
jgi:hypothetical protein